MNKKIEIKRILLFYILAILPLICVSAGSMLIYREPIFADVIKYENTIVFISLLAMISPAIAVLITRLVTKEGFSNSYLLPNLQGNIRYYLIAIFGTLFINILEMLAFWILLVPLSFSDTFTLQNFSTALPTILIQLASSLLVIIHTFGEEWGWRGYLMPKLCSLMGKPLAVLIGGILWGLWHAPLTVIGHNYGVDYPGFPFLGILLMCIFCTCMNAYMTLITERTKSIYPTCFIHGILNNMGISFLIPLFMREENVASALSNLNSLQPHCAIISVGVIVGAISMFIFVKPAKKEQ